MRRLAFFIMVLAWLFQGMMPIFALPMAGTGHPGMTEAMVHQHTSVDAHSGHSASTDPVPHGKCPSCDEKTKKAACAMSLCAACTLLVSVLALEQAQAPAFRYPAPERMTALVSMLPAPLLPPPRA
jgi:hypothetical protein